MPLFGDDPDHPTVRPAAARVKVMLSAVVFAQILADASIPNRLDNTATEYGRGRLDVQYGDNLHIGFLGTVSDLACFTIATRAALGPFDAQMVAQIVQARDTSREGRLHFYFPGLELY